MLVPCSRSTHSPTPIFSTNCPTHSVATRNAQGAPHGARRSVGPMAARYSLILSKGTHLVDESTRRRVLAAIESGERVVEIPVDRYQDGMTTTATVVTSHVVAF